jgi:hypothetical protein
MTVLVFLLLLLPPAEQPVGESSEQPRMTELVRAVEQSGRVLALVREVDDHLQIAPGAPPLLMFRYLEGRERGRFGGLDLVLDDAGH